MPEFIVYSRLIATAHVQRTTTVRVTNADLYSRPRQTVRAIRSLEKQGLIRTVYGSNGFDRDIEVL